MDIHIPTVLYTVMKRVGSDEWAFVKYAGLRPFYLSLEEAKEVMETIDMPNLLVVAFDVANWREAC